MKENGVSGPSSLVYVQAKDLYPKKQFVFDDVNLSVPFPELSGEIVQFLGESSDSIFAISNFRFFAGSRHSFINFPLMLIESLEWKGKEFPEIIISCKNGQSFQLKFDSAEECGKWYDRLKENCVAPSRLENFFAFAYFVWCQDAVPDSPSSDGGDLHCFQPRDTMHFDFMSEYKRMGFDVDPAWKITDINSKFELCPSYPKLHIVPSHITDDKLKKIAKFRASRRFPSAVWRHSENGAVIARCSQPEVGWFYWRCEDDEIYLQTLGNVVELSNPVQKVVKETLNSESNSSDVACGENSNTTNISTSEENELSDNTVCLGVEKKVLVVDCRSYSVAFANRVKGGGSECTEYYPNCKIQFMGLANIHSIRKSFQMLRDLCCRQEEQPGWLASLEATKWLSHISSLIKTALVVVKAVEQERQHVVVHCSDGWDRTPQVVALAELLLDPFYRTIKGFRVLLEREWLAFGHKFADRCGHGCEEDDVNERCPVFLQFLDCVHQLLRQFPCSFEFNETFLVKLVHHTYSCLYGTFLCNTEKQRLGANIRYRTCSVWSMFESQSRNYRNFLYSRGRKVLYPEYQVRNILLWSSLYLSTPLIYFDNLSSLNSSETALNIEHDFPDDYLRTESESRPNVVRRNSDGDVKASSADENLVGNSGTRDDSNLYLTKSLVCKPDTNMGPAKGLLVNGLDRKSDEELSGSCESNTIDQTEVEESDSCEKNSVDQNDISDEAIGGLNSSENKDVDQNGESVKDGVLDNSENTKFDQNGISGTEENIKLNDSLTSSTNTLIEDSNCPITEEIKVANSEITNGHSISESCSESPPVRSMSKAIDCRSNHRISNLCDKTQLLPDELSPKHNGSRISENRYSFKDFDNTPRSPKQMRATEVGKYLDTDGLSFVMDPVQARLVKLERYYRERIEGLETQLRVHESCACGVHETVRPKQEAVANTWPTFEGSNSLSSNGASDICGSWEQVNGDDVQPVLWMPDHLALSCGGCDKIFTLTNRKHHCRNCGYVFCSVCCNHMSPVPSEQLYDPVRVCNACFQKLHVRNGQDITVAAS